MKISYSLLRSLIDDSERDLELKQVLSQELNRVPLKELLQGSFNVSRETIQLERVI